jgi:hypothetical protein
MVEMSSRVAARDAIFREWFVSDTKRPLAPICACKNAGADVTLSMPMDFYASAKGDLQTPHVDATALGRGAAFFMRINPRGVSADRGNRIDATTVASLDRRLPSAAVPSARLDPS